MKDAAIDFPFIFSKVNTCYVIMGVKLSTIDASISSALYSRNSSKNLPGFPSIFYAFFQSKFRFSPFMIKTALVTNNTSGGGLVSAFNSYKAFLSRQSTASFAACIAGIATLSSLSASALRLFASLVAFDTSASYSFAPRCSSSATAVFLLTLSIKMSVSFLCFSTSTIFSSKSALSPATYSAVVCKVWSPVCSLSMLSLIFSLLLPRSCL